MLIYTRIAQRWVGMKYSNKLFSVMSRGRVTVGRPRLGAEVLGPDVCAPVFERQFDLNRHSANGCGINGNKS